jgi:paraquat-inducible protein B
LIVGAWLIYQNLSEKGPQIKIVFKSAEGVEPGKTVVKYKDIEVGKVTDVTFGEALETVIVSVELKKSMRPYLSEKTQFWIMKARLSLNEVEGLDTLLSGVYIVMNPQKGEERIKKFKGLDKIPVVAANEKGHSYILKASTIGSLEAGSPIYYKKLRAGSVDSYKLDPDGKSVTIKVFIRAPFDKLVLETTRFWNASGITADINGDGIEIHTESLTSILVGGLAFDNFPKLGIGPHAKQGHTFTLYDSIKKAKKIQYKRELYFWVYFEHSIRGLKVGAPVEFHGVPIGEVVNYSLIGDAKTAEFRIPILIKIEPERFTVVGKEHNTSQGVDVKVLNKLFEKGFRAQLQSGNLLTGELFVDLDFHKNVPPYTPKEEKGYYILPTVPATLESLKSDIKTVLDRIANIPFEEIGKEIELLIRDVRKSTVPALDATLENTNLVMKNADKTLDTLDATILSTKRSYLDTKAPFNKRLIRLLEELTRTSRSVKNLTDYLERHPESLIRGK